MPRNSPAKLLIGQSITRKTLPGGDKVPFDSGNSAFRFLIERDILSIDPITEPLVKNLGRMVMWQGEDRRIVMYPCNDNRLMNLVAIHPSVESGALGAGKVSPSIALLQRNKSLRLSILTLCRLGPGWEQRPFAYSIQIIWSASPATFLVR